MQKTCTHRKKCKCKIMNAPSRMSKAGKSCTLQERLKWCVGMGGGLQRPQSRSLARMMLPPHIYRYIEAQGKAHRVRDLARNIISYSCQEIGKLQLYAGLKSPKVSVINTNKRGYNFHRTQVRLLHCIVTPSLRPPLLVVRLEGCAPGV